VSTQVLQEFFVTATRKLGMAAEIARQRVETLAQLDNVLVRPELVLAAIDLHRLRSISFWNALVVQAAVAAGCARLLTEDLNAGEVINGVRIENPFV
jgi:predicted nucleic acid-binding protein